MEESNLPQILLETASRPQGLILFTGTRHAGMNEALQTLLQNAESQGRHSVLIHDAEELDWAPRRGLRFLSDTDAGTLAGRRLLDTADQVIDLGPVVSASFERNLVLAEEGRSVVMVQKAPSPLTGLRRVLSCLNGAGRSHQLWRFCDQLQVMVGRMALKTQQGGETVYAHEVLLLTPTLKAALAQENVEAFEQILREGDEGSGSVSFNQSLLQLLLRRKIDIKTAFEATRDPIHLDQTLKKVGI